LHAPKHHRSGRAGHAKSRRVELAVWERLVGPGGKVSATHSYEEELNADLATNQQGAEGYWTLARMQQRQECGERARSLRD
jgi:hypothetical protein